MRGTTSVFLGGGSLFMASGRSAFVILNKTLQPKRVWLPSYLCEVMLEAFPHAHTTICFYPIDEQLNVANEDWLDDVQEGDLVVFIDYFGFNRWDAYGEKARARGAWIVEDACQALLNTRFSAFAHYVVFSPRKFVGVPDGGILIAQTDAFLPEHEMLPPPADWWQMALTASVRRKVFDLAEQGGDKSWFELYQKSEASFPLTPFRMSELSQLILRSQIDWDRIRLSRRVNYSSLAEKLSEIAIYPDLPPDVVPLGFPIRLVNRDEVREQLFAANIFPAVHWPFSKKIPLEFEESKQLSGQILTIPCDQRLDKKQLEKISQLITTSMKRI